MMTVYETVKKYELGNFAKKYRKPNGNIIPLPNLDKLMITEVKDVYINLMEKTATITIFWED